MNRTCAVKLLKLGKIGFNNQAKCAALGDGDRTRYIYSTVSNTVTGIEKLKNIMSCKNLE